MEIPNDKSVPSRRRASVSQRLREHTRTVHRRAERTGIIREMIDGSIDLAAYCLFLRNLEPVYAILERRLESQRERGVLEPLARPALYRAPALAKDLTELAGPAWRDTLPHVAAGRRYAERVATVAEERLIAHAYVRYLGDLSGGRLLRQVLDETLGLGRRATAFYAFPEISQIDAFRTSYREAIDRAAAGVDLSALLEEALFAFELNIALSEEILARACPQNAARPRGLAW